VFHHENIQAAKDMLGNIREQFLAAIPSAEWMTPKNREDAKYKLQQMFFEVGIPTDKDNNLAWPARAHALDGKLGPDYFRNGEIATRVSMERSLSKLLRKPERRSWGGSTPMEVNAFYGPKSNGLWIPAGILPLLALLVQMFWYNRTNTGAARLRWMPAGVPQAPFFLSCIRPSATSV
jgi:predicted metalloendopeptidase